MARRREYKVFCCQTFFASWFKSYLESGVFGVRCSVYGVRCTVFGVRCSVFGVRCSVYGVRCSVYGVRCTVFGVRCTVFGVRCSVYGVRCSVISYSSVRFTVSVYEREKVLNMSVSAIFQGAYSFMSLSRYI